MATDPNQLLSALIGTTGLQSGILQNANQNAFQSQLGQQQLDQGAQNLQLGQQNEALNAQQINANDAAVAQQGQYNTDVQSWLSKGGDGPGLSQLVARYPKQWQALQQSWKIKSDDQAKADLGTFGSVYNALDNGSTDVALSELQNRAAAEKAAGQDTTEIQQHIDQIKAGDPKAIAAVKGWARAQIAAANPDAAKSVGVDVDSDRYKAISGKGVFDTRTGQYIADTTGGGDPASGGTGGDGSAPGSRDTSRLINSDAGGGQVPDSVKTVGQFVTFGKSLNAKGAKSSSAGTYQINGSTMAEFAPKALGADWQNQPFNADAQDKVGEAIFDWAKSQPNPAAALKGRWVSLSTDKAAQLVKGSWDQAKGTIAAGETGGGAGASANAGPDAGPAQSALIRSYGKAPAGFRWVQGGSLEPIPGGPKDNKGGAAYDTDTLNTMADQYLAGDTTVLQNLGRGPQAAEAIRQLRTAIVQRGKDQGLNGAQIAGRIADFKGVLAGERAVGTRTAQVELPAAEAQKLIPLALKASDALPRSSFLPFSKAEQAVRNGVNNPQLRQFVAANNALVNVYSRAVSPSGTPTDSDKAHARQLLDTAYDQKSYRAVVTQMNKEIGAARSAPMQVRQQMQSSVGQTGARANGFTHMSASGAYGYAPGRGWVKVK